jgi:hypothetical protein
MYEKEFMVGEKDIGGATKCLSSLDLIACDGAMGF